MIIWIVSDGKPGHLSQTLGLVDAFKRQCSASVRTLCFDISQTPRLRSWAQASSYRPTESDSSPPDFILGAGHKTHIPVLILAKKWKAKSILCMRSSLPLACFDANIIPYHDFIKPSDLEHWEHFLEKTELRPRVYPTLGAMNRILPHPESTKRQKLILIGGPSKNFSWDTQSIIDQLLDITQDDSQPFKLTTSRRTPQEVIPHLHSALPAHVQIFPVEETDSTWIPQQLKESSEVWVTQDSVSMIFESLGSGARVGTLTVPSIHPNNKVNLGIEILTRQGYICPFPQWKKQGWPKESPPLLAEADRIARRLLIDFHQPVQSTISS